MSDFRIARTRTQGEPPVEVNWAHPLARRLSAVVPGGGLAGDLVTRRGPLFSGSSAAHIKRGGAYYTFTDPAPNYGFDYFNGFRGVGDYQDYTIAAVIRRSANSDGTNKVGCLYRRFDGWYTQGLGFDQNDNLIVASPPDPAPIYISSTTTVTVADRWTVVAWSGGVNGTPNAGKGELYKNGRLVGSTTGFSDGTFGDLVIGGTYWGKPFLGDVGHVFQWYRFLTADEHAEFAARPDALIRSRLRRFYSLPSAGGTTYNVSIAETSSAADAVAALAARAGPLGEAVSATDTVATAAVFTRALVEAGSATDAVAAVAVFTRAIAETATAADSVAAGAGVYAVAVAETASAADTISALAVVAGGLVEAGSGADAVNATGVFTRAVAETATAADSVASGAGVYAMAVAETATAADTIAALAVLVGGLAEVGSATDTVNGLCVFTRAVAESGAAADAVATGGAFYSVAVSESAAAADSVAVLAVLTGGVAEAGSATDAVVAQLVAQSAIVESGLAVDVLAASGGIVISNIFRAAVNDALAFRCVCSDEELAA